MLPKAEWRRFPMTWSKPLRMHNALASLPTLPPSTRGKLLVLKPRRITPFWYVTLVRASPTDQLSSDCPYQTLTSNSDERDREKLFARWIGASGRRVGGWRRRRYPVSRSRSGGAQLRRRSLSAQ